MREDLERIRDAAAEDPALAALVLTGGFSRGEGTLRRGRPVNDYDLVAVRRSPRPGPGARIAADLEHDLGVHVDWLEVWRPRLRLVGPKIFWFDLRRGGRVLAGDAGVLGEVRAWRPGDLPADEALRLLANRAVGLLLARGAAPDDVELQAAKAILAAVEARLVLDGRYAATLAERMARFRLVAEHDPAAAAFLPWAERAAAFKLDPDAHPLGAAAAWDAARAALVEALPRAAAASRWRTLEAWLATGSPLEAAWYAARARGAGLPWFVRNPTARARRAALALLRETDAVPEAARRVLAAFGIEAHDWPSARDAVLRVRRATLQ